MLSLPGPCLGATERARRPGKYFGEMGLVENKPRCEYELLGTLLTAHDRSANVVACGTLRVCMLGQQSFFQYLSELIPAFRQHARSYRSLTPQI
jgi:CRP-like cAMP-binding protein